MIDQAMQFIEKLLRRRSHYRAAFETRSGRVVLADLQAFCYGNKPTIRYSQSGQVDSHASIAAAARQEVYMRIINHLHLDDADLLKMKQQQGESDV